VLVPQLQRAWTGALDQLRHPAVDALEVLGGFFQ
jgi:hypothetical protein